MIKKHKRKNSGYMRRTSRVFFTELNSAKYKKLYQFLQFYANVVRYFIEMLWSRQDFTNHFNYDDIKKGAKRFHITARLSSLAYKQAKEIVNSQRKKSKRQRRMPLFRNITVNVDSRFYRLSEFNQKHFDWALTFSSGFP
ncbi:MAG: hypothetical protein ACK4OF_01115, partial [Aquificaceae bacterium]